MLFLHVCMALRKFMNQAPKGSFYVLGYIKYVQDIPWVGTKPTVWGVQFPLYFYFFLQTCQKSCILNRGREKFEHIASKI
jgi:hypothetical protein